MPFTHAERNALALIGLFCGTALAMYVTEQVTHRPVASVWQVPFGGIAVLWGVNTIRFRQELADRYKEGVKRSPWIGRTGGPYIAPVLYVLPGVMCIIFGIFLMMRGMFAVL